MEEKPSYYSIIPANVRYDKELKANEKLLYSEITALSNKEGYCYATNKYFSNLYDVSIQSVSTWINNLIEKGYLISEFKYKEGTKEIEYRRLSIVLKKTLIPIKENFKGGIKENFKDNNTSNNNIIIDNNKKDDIFDYYQQEIGQLLSPIQHDKLEMYLKKIDIALIKNAIDEAVDRNKKNMAYIEAILKDYISKGYKYITDLEKPVRTDKNDELEGNSTIDEATMQELDDFIENYYKN
jgi:DnaD/phage-associated family protein